MIISVQEYYCPHKCNSNWTQEEKTKPTKQKKQKMRKKKGERKRRGNARREWDKTEEYSEESVELSPSQQNAW